MGNEQGIEAHEYDASEYIADPHQRRNKHLENYNKAMQENCELKAKIAYVEAERNAALEKLEEANKTITLAHHGVDEYLGGDDTIHRLREIRALLSKSIASRTTTPASEGK